MREADVLIQAGHEGRITGATGAAANGLREIDLTPRIADAATGILRASGISVLRDPADPVEPEAKVKIAVAIHLDGPPGGGAQFLYDDPTDLALADYLEAAWKDHFTGRWLPDNTSRLADATGYSRYYSFRHWITTDGEVVMEMDTIGDPGRANIWAQPGYPEWAGRVVGSAIARRLGFNVPSPVSFNRLQVTREIVHSRRVARIFDLINDYPSSQIRPALMSQVFYNNPLDRILWAIRQKMGSPKTYSVDIVLEETTEGGWWGRTFGGFTIQLFPGTIGGPDGILWHEIGHIVAYWLAPGKRGDEAFAAEFSAWIMSGQQESSSIWNLLRNLAPSIPQSPL